MLGIMGSPLSLVGSAVLWLQKMGLLNSRCGLNMKHLQTLEYSQEMSLMTEKKSQEEEPEV